MPPNVVKSVIREALKNAPEISHDRAPEVRLADFGASAIVYRVRFWVGDFEADERAKDLVRSLIYYAFKRNNITIPYPIQVEMSAEEGGVVPVRSHRRRRRARGGRVVLAARGRASAPRCLPSRGRCNTPPAKRSCVRVQAGRSLFVVVRGEASVTLAGTSGEVARLRAGDVFGEMSLLTGEPRTATVTAVDRLRSCSKSTPRASARW